jgi:predicted DNA binding CopG/RHH family protein
MKRYNPRYIDSEEKEIIGNLKNINVKALRKPSKKEQALIRKAAKSYVEKESKMNIRIDPSELAQIKAKADSEGLKYQTLIKSVLHKYINGQLIEKKKAV